MINELSGEPAEQRIRQILGERQREFDVVVVIVSNDPLEYFFKEARKGKEKYEDLKEREQIIRRLGIERMTYASVIVRRRAAYGEPLTLRRQLSPRTRWQDIEWLLELESAFADPDAIPPLLYSKPRAGPGMRSRLEQTIEGGRWKYAGCDSA